MEHHLTTLLIALAFLVAGAAKGISGLGLPTISLGLLSFVISPAAAAALLVLPSLLTNLVQSRGAHIRRRLPALLPLWLAILVGAATTPRAILATEGPGVRLAMGALLLAYGVYGLRKPRLALPSSTPAVTALVSALAGYATGVLTAATGIFIMPLILFLQSLNLQKDEMVQALGISFTICTLALALTVGLPHTLEAASSVDGVIALACALLGVWAGSRLRSHLNLETFRRSLFGILIFMGAAMLAKGWAAK